MFRLRRPCDNCPFLKVGGIRLTQPRVREIANAFTDQGGGSFFPCHKTVNHDYEGEEAERPTLREGQNLCIGGTLFALKLKRENQTMQIASRLRLIDYDKLRGSDLVFDSLRQMLKVNRDEF